VTRDYFSHFGRPFVKRFAYAVLSVCLDVTLVYCGQTVGWIKIKLDVEVGLSHIVSGGDPAPPAERATTPPPHISIVAKRSPISAAAELLFR